MILTDIQELKRSLDIDPADKSEDWKLLTFCEWASGIIENLLSRDLGYKTRTQYYKGTGCQKLQLRARPVYPSPPSPYSSLTVWTDTNGLFGSASGSFQDATTIPLTYGIDYALEIDRDDGGSDCGVLIRVQNYWSRPVSRQLGLLSPFQSDDTGSIKITYTAGYTVDTLPSPLRAAANLLVARLLYLFPLGMALVGESYEERSISLAEEKRNYLTALVKPLIWPYRNWVF